MIQLWLSQQRVALRMGDERRLELRAANRGDRPLEAELTATGWEEDWLALPDRPFLLNPGEERAFEIVIRLPSTRKVRPGDVRGMVQARPKGVDGILGEVPLVVQVLPTIDYQVTFSSTRLETEGAGRFYIQVRNTGNDRVQLRLGLAEEPLYFDAAFQEESLLLEPGQSRSVYLELRPLEAPPIGRARDDRLAVTVSLEGGLRSSQTFELEAQQLPALKTGQFRRLILLGLVLAVAAAAALAGWRFLRPQPPVVDSFSASRSEVKAGDPVTLSWVVRRVRSLVLEPGIGEVPPVGQEIVRPYQDTEYVLYSGGKPSTRRDLARQTIRILLPAPTVASFTATPSRVQAGARVALAWQVLGSERVRIEPEPGDVAAEGTAEVVPAPGAAPAVEYRLVASNAQGDVEEKVTVDVLPATALPYVEAVPREVRPGEPVLLRWRAAGAKEVLIVPPGQTCEVEDELALVPATSTVYRVIAMPITETGSAVTGRVEVVVLPPPVAPPEEGTSVPPGPGPPAPDITPQQEPTVVPPQPAVPAAPATLVLIDPFPGTVSIAGRRVDEIREPGDYNLPVTPGRVALELEHPLLRWSTELTLDAGQVATLRPQPRLILPDGWAWIPGGSFQMGSERGQFDEKPAHLVAVDPFLMLATEVSNRMYDEVDAQHRLRRGATSSGDDQPAVEISWWDALQFCNQMSRREGLEPAMDGQTGWIFIDRDGWRLPTEAEWEFAARGGFAQLDYPWGDQPPGAGPQARCNRGSGGGSSRLDDGFRHAAPVKTFQPNGYGLYQVAGNVWEWCYDWYDTDAYLRAYTQNPLGPLTGRSRVIRGGSYDYGPNECRVFHRDYEEPDHRRDDVGFRPVRSLPRAIREWILRHPDDLVVAP